MRCPFCDFRDTKVVDSREASENALRRRRICEKCARRFTTYERVESTNILVVKKNGAREQFNREKLRRSLLLPCEKLPISSDAIEHALARIEQQLAESRKGEIASKAIGELVMKELKRVHKVAYIRFAAVYREFADLADFESELHKLLKKTKQNTKQDTKQNVKEKAKEAPRRQRAARSRTGRS